MDKDSLEKQSGDNRASQSVRLDILTSATVLARSTIWNLVGQIAPILAAIVSIPLLIKSLGIDRFGILTIAWIVVGYFSLFDLGVGRAVTYFIAKKEGAGEQSDILVLAWTALFMMTAFGLLGAVVMALISPWLVTSVLTVPHTIQSETLHSFYWLAVSIPLVIVTAGLRGMLQAKQRVDLVNAVGIPMGIFSYLAPLAVLPFSSDLSHIVIILVIGKTIALLTYLLLCQRLFPGFLKWFGLDIAYLRPLFSFGGWITASNILAPLTLYIDRFFIGSFVSVAAVAYYATPFEVITKALIIPGALAGAIFPAFSASFGRDSQRAGRIYHLGMKYVFLVLFPITLIAVLFAKELLLLWLGLEFAENSFRALQLLALGVLVNGLAYVPWVFLQGAGRPDIPTKLNIIEIPFYIEALWWLTHAYGIDGAAFAWFVRVSIDTLALVFFSQRLLPRKSYSGSKVAFAVVLMVASLGFAMLTLPSAEKIELFSVVLLIHLGFFGAYLLSQTERVFLLAKMRLK